MSVRPRVRRACVDARDGAGAGDRGPLPPMIVQLSEHRKLVVENKSERACYAVATVGNVGIAEPELEPRDPWDVPGNVQVAFTDRGESDAGRRVDRIPPLGVAQEQRKSGDVDTGKQGPRAEVVPGGEAPCWVARPVEIIPLKGEVAGRVAIGRL